MKNINDKIEVLKNFLENNKRYTFRDWVELILNIKWDFWINYDDAKNILNKKYTMELLNEIDFNNEYDLFFDFTVNDFFEYAKELLLEAWIDNNIYSTGRSWGYLWINWLYREIESVIENIEWDIESINNKDSYFYYWDTKKILHKVADWYIWTIKDIEKVFKKLIDNKKDFEKNKLDYFIDFLENNVLENIENNLK